MAGTWSETNKPSIPGFYNRFKTIAEKRIEVGTSGTLAMPVKSNWGPVKSVVSILNEKDLIRNFGNDIKFTAYKLGRLALLGQPKELLLYRLTDGTEKVASLKLKNTEPSPTDVITLETKYPSTRAFNVTIRTNIADASKKDLLIFEGTILLVTIQNLGGTIDEIVSAINSYEDNVYLIAKKVTGATGTLANIVNQALTGGNDGATKVTNEHYLEAMNVFEGYSLDAFALDGVSDSSLQTSIKIWTETQKNNGNNFISFLGGGSETTLVQTNMKSKELNNPSVVNIADSAYYEEVLYSPAEVAVYVAALSIGLDLKESICNKRTIFSGIKNKHSKPEEDIALKAGTLIFRENNGSVIIVDDKNTFTEYQDEKNEVLGYIRAERFISTVDEDTTLSGDDFIGKTPNDDLGQITVITALKKYFEAFITARIIKDDFTVEVDKELQVNAKNDEFFWKWNANYINVMKKIYGTGYIR
ncbi:phage tail sheath family protein [Clostridium sp. CTA-5]